MRTMITVLGFTLPLCLDVFAVSFGVLGEMRMTRTRRLRISLLFMAFEIGMPLVGMAIGAPLIHVTGAASNLLIDGAPANPVQLHAASLNHATDVVEQTFAGRYLDPVLVPLVIGGIGIWMLDECLNPDDDDDDEADKVRKMVTAHGLSLIGLGIATSVDDLVLGFSLGVSTLPLHDVFTAIVIQAVLSVAVGQFLGWKVRAGSLRLNVGRVTDASKLAAGGVLVGLAVIVLLTPEITTHVIPHFYHPRYIPPLVHPAASASTGAPRQG